MKRTSISVFLIFYVLIAVGQYVTPGTGVNWNLDDLVQNSSGTVTLEEGIYYLWDDLTIAENDTVSVFSDGTLKISADKLITINGVVTVEPSDIFVFTAADTTQNFAGFMFEGSGNSHITKSIIEFGGGIKLVNSGLTFEECIIRKNNKSNSTGAIDIFQSNPQIINCEIYDNEGPAIQSAANSGSSPVILQNNIYRNNSANENMPQINLGTTSENEELKIIGNTIEGYYDNAGGIAVSTLAGGDIFCKIEDNTIINNRYGIAVYGNHIYSEIKDNFIADNNIQNDPMLGGSGINFWGDTTNVSFVSGNEITGNLWGVTILNMARPNLGQLGEDTVNTGNNMIYANGNEGTVYALYNNTPGDIYAENNYWGTYEVDTVEMYIFHKPDDPSLGFVDYIPIKDYLTNKEEIFSGSGIGLIKSFSPNPAKSVVVITFSGTETGNVKEVKIINSTGKEVKKLKTGKDSFSIDLSGLPSGLYIARVTVNRKTDFYKFLIQ